MKSLHPIGPNFWTTESFVISGSARDARLGFSKSSQECEVNQGTYGTCGRLRAAKWSTRFYIGIIIVDFGALQRGLLCDRIGRSCAFWHGSQYKNSLSSVLRRTAIFLFIQKSIGSFLLTFVRYGARNKGDIMSSIRSYRRSAFGATCGQCGHDLIAPEWSEYRNDRHVHHVWRCWKCDCCFETIIDTKTTRDFA
jgi:hypothetical protein